jgi:hypothetical protein
VRRFSETFAISPALRYLFFLSYFERSGHQATVVYCDLNVDVHKDKKEQSNFISSCRVVK